MSKQHPRAGTFVGTLNIYFISNMDFQFCVFKYPEAWIFGKIYLHTNFSDTSTLCSSDLILRCFAVLCISNNRFFLDKLCALK